MKHETEIYDGEPLNFEKVYNRYLKFTNKNSSIESVQKPVIMKAFEHIKVSAYNYFKFILNFSNCLKCKTILIFQNLELIIPVTTNQRIEKEYQSYNFTLTPQQVMEAVKNYQGLPTDIAQWADSSII